MKYYLAKVNNSKAICSFYEPFIIKKEVLQCLYMQNEDQITSVLLAGTYAETELTILFANQY